MVFEVTPSRVLLVLGVVLLIGFLGRWIFARTKIPDTFLLMGVGFAIGYLFNVDTAPFLTVMPYVGVLALIVILFDGGMDLKINDLVSGLPRASALSISGWGFSVIVVTLYGHAILGFTILEAMLLGAIVGGTSAIIIMPLLKGMSLGRRGDTMLGLESAFTDVLCVVGALALATALAEGRGGDPLALFATLTSSFAIAIVIGCAAGVGWLAILNRVRESGAEYVWTMTALLLLYGLVDLLGGSGPIAVLLFGIILGNSGRISRMLHLPERRLSISISRMQDEIVFFVRSFFFVFLGLVFDPRLLFDFTPWYGSPFLKALGLFTVLLLARIAAVHLCTAGDQGLIEQRVRFVLLMPRGLAAAVLASVPAAAPYNLVGLDVYVSYAFAVIVFSNLAAMFAGLTGASFGPRFWLRRRKGEDEIARTLKKESGRSTQPRSRARSRPS
jgi:potassium/hydrogen antiporter